MRNRDVYKLTDEQGNSWLNYNKIHWDIGVTHRVRSGYPALCDPGWIHAYEHPVIALLMDSLYAHYAPHGLMWVGKTGRTVLRDRQIKLGCKTLTIIDRIPLPELSMTKRCEIAIRCALAVCHHPAFIVWANSWLDGTNRTGADEPWEEVTKSQDVTSAPYVLNAAKMAIWVARTAAMWHPPSIIKEWAAQAVNWAAWAAAEDVGKGWELNLIDICNAVVARDATRL